MNGNINNRPVGRCSECGGVVSVPRYCMSTQRPVPTCESCGATADPAAHLPVIPMTPRPKPPVASPADPCGRKPRASWDAIC